MPLTVDKKRLMDRELTPWWSPHRHQDRKPFLTARQTVKSAIRDWFLAQDFAEIEAASLQVSPGLEAHLHAFKTTQIRPDLTTVERYLHTSPEFAMKKLLAAGEEKLMFLGPVFRNREAGPLHLPEFQMLEWYRTGASYHQIMDDCLAVLQKACSATGSQAVSWRGRFCDVFEAAQKITVSDAFLHFTGIDIFKGGLPGSNPAREAFAQSTRDNGLTVSGDDSWSDIFAKALTTWIEPKLGIGRPTLLYAYPISEAALARPCPDDERVAERFELYCCGIELANGFGELKDSEAQRQRFKTEMTIKKDRYGESYPIDEDFLSALDVMPDASGAALGFDRLVMLAAGADNLNQVVWTPFDMDTQVS